MKCANPKCGKKLEKYRNSKYCSDKCRSRKIANDFYNKHLKVINDRVMHCSFCGKKFTVSKFFNLDIAYCSDKCHNKKHYITHKEDIIKRASEWVKNNPEKKKIIQKKSNSKESTKKSKNKWAKKNTDKILKAAIKRVDNLADCYVRSRLAYQGFEFIPKELIELKRIHLKGTRTIKQLTK